MTSKKSENCNSPETGCSEVSTTVDKDEPSGEDTGGKRLSLIRSRNLGSYKMKRTTLCAKKIMKMTVIEVYTLVTMI